jgi:hypothetical protein
MELAGPVIVSNAVNVLVEIARSAFSLVGNVSGRDSAGHVMPLLPTEGHK